MSVLCDDHVYMAGADIDALCVAPRHVERAEFFTSFIERLQSEPGIRDLRVCDLLLISLLLLFLVPLSLSLLAQYFLLHWTGN